jgi:hypothetical protein
MDHRQSWVSAIHRARGVHGSDREQLVITETYYLNVAGELDKEQSESLPRVGTAHLNLGLVFAPQGQYEKSKDALLQSLRLVRMSPPHM